MKVNIGKLSLIPVPWARASALAYLLTLSVAVASTIRVPEGFEIELVAAAPLTRFPVMGGFDDRGRLFIAENTGENLNAAALLERRPNRVSVLEDTDGDGKFDTSRVFVDQLTFPQGALWHDGALYVASPPGIWRFEDNDGDGKAEVRKQLATGFAFTGNAADVHGPFLHPNGRIYWCHGRKGHEVYQADGTLVSKNLGARIWSCRPDGSDIQVHAGGGMDNPTEVTFNQEGEIFGTVNIFNVNPRSDAVVHWVHGGVYARPDQEKVMAEFKHTGDLLPPVTFLGHVAPAGIDYLRSDAFGPEYRDNVLLAQFNTRRIVRVPLQREGSTFRGRAEVFASSPDPTMHFTDVIEDADGSVLVVDTGAWFRIGCPTSGVSRTDITGGIYRIRRQGSERIADPRGVKLAWAEASAQELVQRFADRRPAVRDRALAEISRQGAAVIPALAAALGDSSHLVRSNAVWALTRIRTPDAATVVRRALRDADPRIRQVACHSAFITEDRGAVQELMARVGDEDTAVRREAARALGRLKQADVIPVLLEATGRKSNDRLLDHALIHALIEIGRPEALAEQLERGEAGSRRAALIALDQLAPHSVAAEPVFRALYSPDAELRAAALGIASRRREWAEQVPGFLSNVFGMARPELAEAGARMLVKFITTPETAAWWARNSRSIPRRVSIEAIAGAKGAWDESWRDFLLDAVRSADPDEAEAALQAIAVHHERGFRPALVELSHDTSRPTAFRVAALQIAAGGAALDDSSFRMLTEPFVANGTPDARQQAASVLSRAKFSREQLMQLAGLLPRVGPLEMPLVIRGFLRGPADPAVAAALVKGLKDAPGRWTLKPDDLYAVFRRFPPAATDEAASLVTELLDQRETTDGRVNELEKLVAHGEAERGRKAFLAGQGSCVSCHRIGDTGGRIGPDLTQIGRIRTTRDLLEAIAFPNATIARGYETFQVQTGKGETHTGTILRELADQIVFGTFDGREISLPRGAIVKLEPVPSSLMPPGLDRVIEPAVLGDLVAFLKTLQ